MKTKDVIDQAEKEWNEKPEEWKKEVGEIPENTCPSIDKIIKDIESYVDEIEYLRKNAHKYDSAEELGKDLPDFGWNTPTFELDQKLRKDNEKLRELGQFWYEKCKEISFSTYTKDLLQSVVVEGNKMYGAGKTSDNPNKDSQDYRDGYAGAIEDFSSSLSDIIKEIK